MGLMNETVVAVRQRLREDHFFHRIMSCEPIDDAFALLDQTKTSSR